MSKALVLGSTGLVGSAILSTLRSSPSSQFSSIEIIARRSPPKIKDPGAPVNEFVEEDTTKWAGQVSSISPSVVFTGLATTRAIAGGFEKQYKLEHDLNVELAKAAKQAGTKTYVIISSTGADANSSFGYPRMKGEIEEHIKELGFDHTIILRPGLLVGQREKSRGMAEGVLGGFANLLGKINRSLKDVWAQDADVIAKAAVLAVMKAERGEVSDKVWVLGQSDIVRLGSREWKA